MPQVKPSMGGQSGGRGSAVGESTSRSFARAHGAISFARAHEGNNNAGNCTAHASVSLFVEKNRIE